MALNSAVTAAAAAGADFPVFMDVCASDADCGVELLQDRVLDAVKLYTETFLRVLNVKNVEEEGEEGEITSGGGGGSDGGLGTHAVVKSVMASVSRSTATTDESDCEPNPEQVEPNPEPEEPPAVSMWDGDDGEEEVEAVESGEMENTTALEVARAAKEEAAELRGEVDDDEAAAAAAPQPMVRVLSPMETALAQDGHDDWQRARDPAVPMFAHYFGNEWAERMAEEVLFPRGLAVAELVSKNKEMASKPRGEEAKEEEEEEEEGE